MVPAVAQDAYDRFASGADSLKRILHAGGLSDGQRLALYEGLAIAYQAIRQDSCVVYGLQGVSLAENLKDYAKLSDMYNHLGVAYCFMGDYGTALDYFRRSAAAADNSGDINKRLNALSLFGYAYAKQSKYHTAIDYYLKVLPPAEEHRLPRQYIRAATNLAEIYRVLGNHSIAFKYLQAAEKMCGELEQDTRTWPLAHIYNEYAFNYLKQGDMDRAMDYAVRSDVLGDAAGIVNRCFTKSLMARICLRSGDYSKALRYAGEAYAQADILKDAPLYADVWKIFADIYVAQGLYPEAEAAAMHSWRADSTDIDGSRSAAKTLTIANIHMHNPDKAMYFLERYSELNDLYSEKSFHTTVSDMAVKYETDRKEIRIASLERQRVMFAAICVAVVLLIIVLAILFRQKIKTERKERQLVSAKAILEWEKQERKRFASDLHDGINGMLAAMKIEIGTINDLQYVQDKLDDCIDTIRRMARGMMPVSLERYGMKAALEDYCRLFPNVKFHFFGHDRRINERIELVVYYCAFELINNAFKHSGASVINVQLIQDSGRVSLAVQDDGCGFDAESVKQGMGLKNMAGRVAAFKGKADIESSPGEGTEVNIEFEIEG